MYSLRCWFNSTCNNNIIMKYTQNISNENEEETCAMENINADDIETPEHIVALMQVSICSTWICYRTLLCKISRLNTILQFSAFKPIEICWCTSWKFQGNRIMFKS